LAHFTPPAAACVAWPGFCRMIERLRDVGTPWTGQVALVREWYQPQLERLYDYAAARAGDLDQLEQIAAGYTTRERFLTELTLDPPDASGAEAGRPQLWSLSLCYDVYPETPRAFRTASPIGTKGFSSGVVARNIRLWVM